MSTIVVKNLPDDLHVRLKERAEHNHRSMTKEVVHLIEAGLGRNSPPRPLPAPVELRSGKSQTIEQNEAAIAEPTPEPGQAADGRAALRAALIKQPDGSYVNVLGIEDDSFFETLERIRAETRAPNVEGLFDEAS